LGSLKALIANVSGYLDEDDCKLIGKADRFAAEVYSGEHRLSGHPYISHARSVAEILATMRLDAHAIIAGLLHGVLKQETGVREDDLVREFGEDVASLVAGTTRINRVNFDSSLTYQAENIRKMLLAMSADIRVLLVRLADRFQDMQSLEYFTPARQREFARETMDLYAPLASRLGIDWMKRELEDLSFAYLEPEAYASLVGKMRTSTDDRQAYVDEVKKIISGRLEKQGISEFRILGRPKHLYSIYKKLIVQNIPLEKVYDKVAFRIIVNEVSECYEVMGLLHSIWIPVGGRFKDFISSPKANMYQSLHTTVIGPYGEFMEVQIRTEEMDKIANDGIAAHWAYKEGRAVSRDDARFFEWLKQLVASMQELQDPREIIDAVKGELGGSKVYVLTPGGEVKELSQGACPIDFAYAIHSEVGDHCAGAKVNGRMVPLRHELKNGDLVEIITSPKQHPNRGWLAMVKTSRARSRVRAYLRQEEAERALRLGRDICERELKKHETSLKKLVKTGHIKKILKDLGVNSLDDLLRKVGAGRIAVGDIVNDMLPQGMREEVTPLVAGDGKKRSAPERGGDPIVVDGIDGMLVRISHCCMPVPGDEIMGFITIGRGVSVHKADCPNLLASDIRRRIPVEWAQTDGGHRVHVKVTAHDQKGLLVTLGSVIASADANIVNLEANSQAKSGLAYFDMVIEVSGLEHLKRLIGQLRGVDGVLGVERV